MANVMVVDDDDQVRGLLFRVLTADSHQVRQAGDGQAAVDLCRADPPQLMVIDLIMPVKEGLETIRELRPQFPDMRILAISGGGLAGTGSYLRLAQKLGADAVLAKPFGVDDLRSAVGGLLGKAPAGS